MRSDSLARRRIDDEYLLYHQGYDGMINQPTPHSFTYRQVIILYLEP
jgi:hypothetical protein